MNKNLLKYLLLVFPFCVFSQSVDLETFGKPSPLKITGGISANSVFYKSNLQNSRDPFTYFLQGNLNVSLYGFSVPISYSYSNQGNQLGYQLPFNFNRLSLHPKYKWITGHLGDVNMTFSPYTLNGHQFTGVGVDVVPNQDFTFSAMYGRLLKATEASAENPQVLPSYKRVGYGFKTLFKKEQYSFGITTFYAVDQVNSVIINPDEKGVLPKENLVLGLEGGVNLTQALQLKAEYATTALTQDTRAEQTNKGRNGILGSIFNNRASTEYYNAYKLGLQYRLQQASLGLGYERIDPGYETLGAYFFNNDFENITINVASPFFDNKLSLGFNIGYQKDDLNDQKVNSTNRFVGAINASLNVSERLSISGSYSNFSTFTNVRVNQFDNINDDNLLDNALDTLNYRQTSKNANININYMLSNKKTAQQNINLNYNVSDIANMQGGFIRVGDASTFHNLGTAYTIGMPDRNINITSAVNATYNTIGKENATTWGPTLSVSKNYFKNTLNTVLSSSYNTTTNTTGKVDITNFRLGISYVLWKKHNISLNAVQLFKSNPTSPKLNEFTGTFGYNYSFDLLKKENSTKEKRSKNNNSTITIKYKKYQFKGTIDEVTTAILQITEAPDFGKIPTDKVLELKKLETNLINAVEKKEGAYKESAVAYLKFLAALTSFKESYQTWLILAYNKLIREAEEAGYRLEKEYILLNAKDNDSNVEKTSDFKKTLAIVNKRYEAHKNMLIDLKTWNVLKAQENQQLKTFKATNIDKIYEMSFENRSEEEILNFIEYRLADLYHSQVKKHTPNN